MPTVYPAPTTELDTRMTILTQNFLNSIRNMVNFELCNEIEKDGFSS